ncbi:hypothetical protein GCM10007108_13150 [Thermogymnomonas acidicola]|uniref:Uncharacterized protein n=1 Tax=Thermogymnomonas acidicola TaxID=399579 RepID=A0AA37BS53_9ARCH|nr:hypothetical protein GCM10007108_13150 [Thermogymnomonas acidicola]
MRAVPVAVLGWLSDNRTVLFGAFSCVNLSTESLIVAFAVQSLSIINLNDVILNVTNPVVRLQQ